MCILISYCIFVVVVFKSYHQNAVLLFQCLDPKYVKGVKLEIVQSFISIYLTNFHVSDWSARNA